MGRRRRAAWAAVAGGALLVGARAAPAGAGEVTNEQRTDYTFTARNGEEVTCTVAGYLLVGRSSEPPLVDVSGSTSVTGPDLCRDSLISVSVMVEYRRDDQEQRDFLSSANESGTTASVSARLWGATVSDVRGSHGAAFRCILYGYPTICAPAVHTSTK